MNTLGIRNRRVVSPAEIRAMVEAAGGDDHIVATSTGELLVPDSLRRSAIRAYEAGLSMRQTARRAGVGEETLRRWLTDAGVPLRTRGRPVVYVNSEGAAA